jgi:hypothetical protein
MSTESTESSFSEALSPAEAAYFSSRGEKTEGLAPSEPAAAPSEPVQAETQASEGDAAPQAEPGAVDDEEGIYIDEDGKARSVLTGKFVPHAALHKERERRKSVEAEYLTVREKMARAEERLAVLNEVLQQPQAPQLGQQQPGQVEEIPDPEKDIFAYVKYQAKLIEDLKAAQNQVQERTQQQEGLAQLQKAYVQDAQTFAKDKPDFKDAYSHLANSRARELMALGYNEQQIRSQLTQEETHIVAQAFQQRRSPAAVLYEQALARGYTPKQAAAAAQAINPAQKLETVARGQATQKSLSGAGGSSGEGLTVEALANMSEEEFAAVSAKLGKSKLRALMGG